jgi:thioredoxin-related protein
MKTASVLILTAIFVLLTRCEAPSSNSVSTNALSVLEATRSKMLTTPTHKYRFTSSWDNRYARSSWADTMDITYSWLPDSELGFGFYAAGSNSDVLYDGKDKLKIDHNKRKVVRTTAAEIGKAPDYFAHSMCFHGDPKALPDPALLDRVTDTIIGGKKLYAYSVTTKAPSAGNPVQNLVSTRIYYLDPERQVVDRIRNISHAGQDTSQVIDYFFSNYSFADDYHEFGDSDRAKSLAYREINKADDKKERLSGLISPGAQLHRADYTDINGEEQLIYGKAAKKTVIMFGFIGCGNCELAFREMKKKKFAVRDDIDLIYSSPINDAPALRNYLKKKEFPFTSFGEESRMNDNFKAAGFPTFVLINEQGRVERVIGGYDDEVAKILFL